MWSLVEHRTDIQMEEGAMKWDVNLFEEIFMSYLGINKWRITTKEVKLMSISDNNLGTRSISLDHK